MSRKTAGIDRMREPASPPRPRSSRAGHVQRRRLVELARETNRRLRRAHTPRAA